MGDRWESRRTLEAHELMLRCYSAPNTATRKTGPTSASCNLRPPPSPRTYSCITCRRKGSDWLGRERHPVRAASLAPTDTPSCATQPTLCLCTYLKHTLTHPFLSHTLTHTHHVPPTHYFYPRRHRPCRPRLVLVSASFIAYPHLAHYYRRWRSAGLDVSDTPSEPPPPPSARSGRLAAPQVRVSFSHTGYVFTFSVRLLSFCYTFAITLFFFTFGQGLLARCNTNSLPPLTTKGQPVLHPLRSDMATCY